MSDRRWTIFKTGPHSIVRGPDCEDENVMPVPDDAAVERVARGLAIVDGSPDHHWRDYVFNARAVLAALMSPEP